jgi:hypothetical protein
MTTKIVIYGDSFSTPANCNTVCESMWYRHIFVDNEKNEFVSRARAGNSTGHMFLEASHDCITNTQPITMIIGLGPLTRLPTYTDGWHDESALTDIDTSNNTWPAPPRRTDLSDCLKYMDSYSADQIDSDRLAGRIVVDLFHPTLLWANLYKNIISLSCLAKKNSHKLLIVHMHHVTTEYFPNHPLMKPLEQSAQQCAYFGPTYSCHKVCKEAGIKPWDYDLYGQHGHHSVEGQQYFGKYIKDLLQKKTLN